MKNASPMRRMADPDEMVGPALMLTSDAGSFVTGRVTGIAGGVLTIESMAEAA